MCHTGFNEEHFVRAEELWGRLSPSRQRSCSAEQNIFRGHGDAEWDLVPVVLRREHREKFRPVPDTASGQLIHEFALLRSFCRFCDQCGVRIPGDSLEFRNAALDLNNQDHAFRDLSKWPNQQLLEVMAMAQHHGVPTRLLDWSRYPYTAVYFAAVDTLRRREQWTADSCLAIWILDIERIATYAKTIRVVTPPGAVSPNLAAQSGLLTVHTQHADNNGSLAVTGLESEFTIPGDTPLTKLTIPTAQSIELYEYCCRIGTTGATLLPGPNGAATAVLDEMYAHETSRWLREHPELRAEQAQAARRRQGASRPPNKALHLTEPPHGSA